MVRSDYFHVMNANGLSLQEQDLALFLETLGAQLPKADPGRSDGYVVMTLGQRAAAIFKSKDDKTALLGYRHHGTIFPLSIHYLTGDSEILFGHSTLLLNAYSGDTTILPTLQKAMERFFAQEGAGVLRRLDPSWADAVLKGHVDSRILWDMKPTIRVAVDACMESLGKVPELPLFPSVYSYNNPYIENLLEVGLPELFASKRALVLGTGSGLDAVCIAMKYKIPVDATDINPVAAANTNAVARRCGVERYVRAYTSDAFKEIYGSFDTIFFEAPLATDKNDVADINRYDFEGTLLRRVLSELPNHLLPKGRMYLMSCPDISSYVNSSAVFTHTRRNFKAQSDVAIHEIRLERF
jgi:hypothetical protein